VMTMANDFHGEPRDFAIVIPVPTLITRGQIHIANKALIDHLDAYSAPRLVEYFDDDPCSPRYPAALQAPMGMATARREMAVDRANSLGVTIEARYTVGEYDILILSARESGGLETWLRDNGYRLPAGASSILGSYLTQGMKFFVARVNLKEQARLGFTYLRPLQMAFESPKFMLPIRLGTLNADGAQELFVYALTRKGRVETTNYRTVRLPTGMELPGYVRRRSSRSSTVRCSASRSSARTCARCSSSTRGTWPGVTRAPPSRSRSRSCASSACSGWTRAAPGGAWDAGRPEVRWTCS